MDFPPMDWGALFTLDHATFEPPLADPPGTPVIGEANSLAAFPKTQHKDGMQPSEANTIARLGVCSSCRKKKRRCNLQRPSCSLCRINGWVCEYRHVKKKPGPPPNSFVRRSASARSARSGRVEDLATPPPEVAGSTTTQLDPAPQSEPITDRPPLEVVDISSSISVSVCSDRNLVAHGSALSLSHETTTILISLYFDNVQPIFPLFRRAVFEIDLRDHKVPEALLCMMFALASRYVPSSELLQLFGPDAIEPWEHFARLGFKSSRFNDENDSDAAMSLDDVKTSFLLALHEYTSFPGRRAWMRIGNTVRVAIAAGLHQVDQSNKTTASTIPDAELEERRLTWWAVWRVDSSINVLAGSPFNIETSDTNTALPSSSTANFTTGIIAPSSGDFLPTDVISPWKSIQELQRITSVDSPNFYYQTVSYNREAAICRRRLYSQPTPELMGEFKSLKQVLPYLKIALPHPFFAGARLPTEENRDKHRQRLETLILLYITEIVLYLPVKEEGLHKENTMHQKRQVADWQLCIDSIEEIAALLNYWEPSYSRLTDPMISCIIWISCSVLVLHTMSTTYQQAKIPGHGDSIEESLLILTTALEGFSRYWPIARLLLKSLQNLRSWNWLSLGFEEVVSVASQLQSPVNPQAQNPATINVWPVFASPNEEALDDGIFFK